MAGIGFELKKIIEKKTLFALIKTYGFSAALSSGPWVISMIIVLLIGFFNIYLFGSGSDVGRFQSVVTYVIMLASSLVFTGFLQLPFTRFIADTIYKDREDLVVPNFLGLLTILLIAGFIISIPLGKWFFYDQSKLFILIFISTFLVLNAVWISNILAISLRFYKVVIATYFIAYSGILFLSIYWHSLSVEGLLLAFLVGNTFLFFVLLIAIVKHYPSTMLIRFDFFNMKKFYWSLGFAGFFYNAGVWIDKLIFWYHPLTGSHVIGNIHTSVVYDLPIFLAYLAIIPGMAVFFYRLEADFSQHYDNYYDSVRKGGVLSVINRHRQAMINSIRLAIREVFIIQGFFSILLFLFAEELFSFLKLPQLYLPLFYIDLVGTQLQLAFMSILAILFYLDRRHSAAVLTIVFFLTNALFTYISIYLGPYFFGYGFAVSLLVVALLALITLKRVMHRINYETFMLQ
jgi:polysaccharide biosynthesis protein PelG